MTFFWGVGGKLLNLLIQIRQYPPFMQNKKIGKIKRSNVENLSIYN